MKLLSMIVLALGIVMIVQSFLPEKDKYVCTENTLYVKHHGENFWRKENVYCLPEDKE